MPLTEAQYERIADIDVLEAKYKVFVRNLPVGANPNVAAHVVETSCTLAEAGFMWARRASSFGNPDRTPPSLGKVSEFALALAAITEDQAAQLAALNDAEVAYCKAMGAIRGANESYMTMARTYFDMHSLWVKCSITPTSICPNADVKAAESVSKLQADLLTGLSRLEDGMQSREYALAKTAIQNACLLLLNAL